MLQARRGLGQKTWEALLLKVKKRSRGRKEEELLSSPNPVEMLWQPWRTNDDSCDKGLEVFFMLEALCGKEMRERSRWKRERESSR